jgi:hypothetical protein
MNTQTLRLDSCLLALLAGIGLGAEAQTTNWIAYNDHNRGAGTAPNVTTYSLTAAGPVGGPLTNYATGEIPTNAGAAVGVSITLAGTLNGSSGSSGSPHPGTPAYLIWNGLVDWTNSALYFGGSSPYDASVTYTFTNLDSSKQYSFRGTFVRAASLTNRWTLATIAGVPSCTPAHATGIGSPGIATNGWLPYGTNLALNTQAAWNSGHNTNGDVIGWDHIVPSGGSFSVVCSNWRATQTICPLADGSQGTLGNFYAYAFGAWALAEAPVWPLSISLTAPGPGTTWFSDQPVWAGASILGGTVPYTNTVFYTNFNNTGWAVAGRLSEGSPSLNLGPLAPGTYQIYAATTDSAEPPATVNSLTNSFTILIRPLIVTLNAPTNNARFGVSQSVWATATVVGGLAPYLVTFYTNTSGGEFAEGQTLLTNGTVVCATLGVMVDGDYSTYVRVVDKAGTGGAAYSSTNGFVVGPPRHYVWPDSPSPVPPYTNWGTAAHTIQEAVDAAAAGEVIVVTNGLYASGGRAVSGTMTNRVVIDRPVLVRSVNGPEVTIIQGRQVPGTTNGDGAIRCVYLTNSAVLSGFTLTKGATRASGISSLVEQSGGGVWCESRNALLTNCTFTGNSASWDGAGAYQGTLNNCMFTGNCASLDGGGAYESTLNNCTLTANSAARYGGGAYDGTLNNCTVTGNSALGGGGTYYGILNNCILYYNTAGDNYNYDSGTLNYCCTTPLPPSGTGNISAEPQLASASRLSAASPCRGAGSAAYATGVDIDGESWLSPPAIGCDEFHAGAATGALAVAIGASWTNVAVGFGLEMAGWISGHPAATAWDFGDATVMSNRPYASHTWAAAGDYAVVLWAFNETHPEGVSAKVTVRVVTEVHHVAAGSTNPVPPYSSWQTAAQTIQDAVDVTTLPGALVLVTNGLYATGGRAVYRTMTNRVVIDRPVLVRSVNGPQVTVVQGRPVPGTTNGNGAIRCAYLTNGAVLSGFTLTNGATRSTGDYEREQCGGGVWCNSANALVTNCTLTGNSAYDSAGGAYRGTLNNCTLTGNAAPASGGGAYSSTLDNCTLTGNSADYHGGGAAQSTLNNCALTGNSCGFAGGGAAEGTLNNCMLTGNSADHGGGAAQSTLNNCALTGNSASYSGGGAFNSTLNNCALTGNSAGAYSYGGGAYSSTLNNCTLTGNSASIDGGGAYSGILNNCIVYDNVASSGANYSTGTTVNYCCTTPLPGSGSGNISNEPLFLDQPNGNLRLQSNSLCINAGLNDYAPGPTDLDGNPRIVNRTVDMGAYEWRPGPKPCRFATLPPPGPGGVDLCLSGEIGRALEIYTSSNLVNWVLLIRQTNTTGQVIYTDAVSPCPPARFYKAVNPAP